jgi:PAS domain S-box-containing protein
VEQSPATVVITDTKGNIEYVNPKFTQLTGYTFKETIGKNPRILKSGKTPPEEYKQLWETINSGREWYGEFCNKKKNGELYWESASISPVRNTEGVITHFVGIKEDITKRKKMEETLQAQNKELEHKNIALNEVLGQIELEKKQIKDNVIANIENLLLPIIQKLMLKRDSRDYVQLLRKNLQELTSSFGIKLTEKRAKLTSREIEICNMVKNGITSKEIASLLNISFLTIEKHRINIRRKLGIINKDINLTSFLKTL